MGDYGYNSEVDFEVTRGDSILDLEMTWHQPNFETTKPTQGIELRPTRPQLIDNDVQCTSALIISNSDIDGTAEKIKINSNGCKDYGYINDH